jgi:hypothetical protein
MSYSSGETANILKIKSHILNLFFLTLAIIVVTTVLENESTSEESKLNKS